MSQLAVDYPLPNRFVMAGGGGGGGGGGGYVSDIQLLFRTICCEVLHAGAMFSSDKFLGVTPNSATQDTSCQSLHCRDIPGFFAR